MKECQQCKRCFSDDVDTCPDDGTATSHTLNGAPVLEEKYHLERRLGQGGMGVVYKARHAYLKTQHAIKLILPDLVGNDPQLVTRFRQEALAAAAIRHQNVVGVSDYGVAFGKIPFLVMEYVEGESLHDLLAREGRLSPQRALELMSAICAGVGAAHHQGIVHRDLKPLNIMLCTGKKSLSESVKILDFGLAKIKSGELLGSFIQAQTTGLMGSPYYMAPEQWADEEPDVRADIYSLGVMLFQMLTGDVPFKGSSIPAIMKKHLSDVPPSFEQLGIPVAPQVEQAVRHSIEKNRQNRTQTVEQLVEELSSAVRAVAAPVAPGATTASALPVSRIRIFSDPARARVFVDNVAVGLTHDDGWLQLEGIQSGNHHIRVNLDGFRDWEVNVVCDGHPQQVVARLMDDSGGIPRPDDGIATSIFPKGITSAPSLGQTNQASQFEWQGTSSPPAGWQTASQAPAPRSSRTLLVTIIGIGSLLLLTTAGLLVAWQSGLFGSSKTGNPTPTPNSNGQNPPPATKAEMVKIPGGKFTMGRNDGDQFEKPEYEAEVRDFEMDKTEVTNAEYSEFVQATGYNPLPLNWENAKPLTAEMNFPVRYVNLEDIKAFADWRSKRDGAKYRLPTEEEWEYAARNGSAGNLYPWGDTWYQEFAHVRRDLAFAAVGSKPKGANKWGVLDLVGNIWEWTSSPAAAYKGSNLTQQVEQAFGKTHSVVRGAFDPKKAESTSTSTYRVFKDSKDRDKAIGFRLVRSD